MTAVSTWRRASSADELTITPSADNNHPYAATPGKMFFLLVALVYGFGSWRNLVLAGGVLFLAALWDDFDETAVKEKWEQVEETIRNE